MRLYFFYILTILFASLSLFGQNRIEPYSWRNNVSDISTVNKINLDSISFDSLYNANKDFIDTERDRVESSFMAFDYSLGIGLNIDNSHFNIESIEEGAYKLYRIIIEYNQSDLKSFKAEFNTLEDFDIWTYSFNNKETGKYYHIDSPKRYKTIGINNNGPIVLELKIPTSLDIKIDLKTVFLKKKNSQQKELTNVCDSLPIDSACLVNVNCTDTIQH